MDHVLCEDLGRLSRKFKNKVNDFFPPFVVFDETKRKFRIAQFGSNLTQPEF